VYLGDLACGGQLGEEDDLFALRLVACALHRLGLALRLELVD